MCCRDTDENRLLPGYGVTLVVKWLAKTFSDSLLEVNVSLQTSGSLSVQFAWTVSRSHSILPLFGPALGLF